MFSDRIEKELNMKREKLRRLIFMALCCDLGIFAKKLIVPAANFITDFLHIPGGIGASFSLMFIVIAAAFVPRFGAATLMGAVQSGIALCMGTVGSMGALAPLGYILPGIAIDCVMLLARRLHLRREESLFAANICASVAACLAANMIVFSLHGIVLGLYVCVSALSGSFCGILAGYCAKKLDPIFGKEVGREKAADSDRGASAADGAVCRAASDGLGA